MFPAPGFAREGAFVGNFFRLCHVLGILSFNAWFLCWSQAMMTGRLGCSVFIAAPPFLPVLPNDLNMHGLKDF